MRSSLPPVGDLGAQALLRALVELRDREDGPLHRKPSDIIFAPPRSAGARTIHELRTARGGSRKTIRHHRLKTLPVGATPSTSGAAVERRTGKELLVSSNGIGASQRDRPWIMRTYAGHSTAAASNELYRTNLKRGQTGLSVAFDLPTQTGYDPDHVLATGEVGKVGVPVSHIGDMRTLFSGVPLDQMNTSMTINATAPWLLALYIAVAEEQGVDRKLLQGTTQNDLIKEYLSRGTYIFPPGASLKLTADVIAYTVREVPEVEPGQHLQLPPAGSGRDAGAGARVRAVAPRSPCSTRCARAGR